MVARWKGLALAVLLALPALAARADGPALSVELNAAVSSQSGCRVSFLVENGLAERIDATVFEVAVIDTDGKVGALIRLDFGRLPAGKSRVRQFDLADQPCERLSRMLLNDVAECSGEGLTPDVCLDALAVSTRTRIAFDL